MSTATAPNAAVDPETDDVPERTPAAEPARELARYDPDHGAMVVPTNIPGLTLAFTAGQETLTAEQMHMLAPLGIKADWNPAQVAVFLLQCNHRGFDPWAKQAYLLEIDKKLVYHIGIGGLLGKAEETGLYRGTVGPQWCGPDGQWRDVWLDGTAPPAAARVGIQRAGFDHPVWGVATYEEYAPLVEEWAYDEAQKRRVPTGRKRPMANWRPARAGGKPAVMLAKVAKAAGLRDAFPDRCSGFYLAEETEKTRTEEHARQPQPTDDDASTRRRAAFDAAMAEAGQAGPFPVFAGMGLDDGKAHGLLLAELDEQAAILGKTRGEVTVRWVASRGGTPVERWDVRTLGKAVRSLRPYVLTALREAGDDAQADRYMTAPDIGTVEELFGRPATTIESTSTPTVCPACQDQDVHDGCVCPGPCGEPWCKKAVAA